MVRKNKQTAIPHIELVLLWIKRMSRSSWPLVHVSPFHILYYLLTSIFLPLVLVPIFWTSVSASRLALHFNDLEQFWSLPFKLIVKFQAWMDHSNGCLQELLRSSYHWGQKTGFKSCTDRIWEKLVATVRGKFNRVEVEKKIGSRNAQWVREWAQQRRGTCS